jgi:hypothetical protein
VKAALASGEPGTCVVTRPDDPLGTFQLRVDHADPRIWITAELLEQIPEHDAPATLKDGVLTINGVNRKVIYRIGRYLPERGVYEAEWPD